MEDQQLQPGPVNEADEALAPQTADEPVEQVASAGTARKPTRWAPALLALAAAVFVAAAGFAGAMMQPYLTDRAVVATKLTVARAAANAVTALWTYTPGDVDTLPNRAAEFLTGDFEARYRKFFDAVAAANKQQQLTVSTEVTGVAVESVTDDRATAIVYTNTTSSSPRTRGIATLQYRSYQMTMKRENGHWLATELTNITKFSLTPQL